LKRFVNNPRSKRRGKDEEGRHQKFQGQRGGSKDSKGEAGKKGKKKVEGNTVLNM